MIKRFIIAIVLLAVVVGGIVGFNMFRDNAISQFFANMPVAPSPVSTVKAAPVTWTPGIQALARGNASMDQQKRALAWIIESAAGTYEMSYRPGAGEGDRDTVFAEGRRFVGNQVVKMTKLKIGKL